MSGPDSADHPLAMIMTRCGFCSFEDRKTHFPAFTPKTLDTNEPPLPSETFALRQSLAETRRELEHVNAELEFAKAAVIRMKETRSRVLSSIHDHEKAQRPILSVPDDVLRVIFEWAVCLCLERGTYYLQTVDRASPWTISRTCSRWRVLAISYQPLWCNLIVQKYYINSLSLLELSLQRSASTECGFAVHLPLSKEEEIDRFKNGLASLLEPTSGRWRSLTLYTSSDSLNDAFRGWSFERLAQLDVDFDECSHSELLLAAVTTLRDTPMLRRVRMEHLSNHHQLDIPWGQLVFYESRSSDLGILSQLSAVETILIYGHEQDWPDTFDLLKTKAPIRFPFLRTLSLQVDDNGELLLNLSEILEVPVLNRLLFKLRDGWTPGVGSECLNIRLLEHLTHLSITGNAMPYLLNLLRCARRVSVLHLVDRALNVPLLRALQDAHLLPSLRCLQTTRYGMMNSLAGEIMTTIEGRDCRFQIIGWPSQSHHRMEGDTLDKWRGLCTQGIITSETSNREFQLEHIML